MRQDVTHLENRNHTREKGKLRQTHRLNLIDVCGTSNFTALDGSDIWKKVLTYLTRSSESEFL